MDDLERASLIAQTRAQAVQDLEIELRQQLRRELEFEFFGKDPAQKAAFAEQNEYNRQQYLAALNERKAQEAARLEATRLEAAKSKQAEIYAREYQRYVSRGGIPQDFESKFWPAIIQRILIGDGDVEGQSYQDNLIGQERYNRPLTAKPL